MKNIEIKTADGVVDCLAWAGSEPDSKGNVLFFVDAGGVRPAMERMGQRWADAGYSVLIPNVLYRAGKFAPFHMKTVFSDDKERARLFSILSLATPADIMRDVGEYLQHFQGKVGAVGYCFGGTLTTRAAAAYPERIAVAASIHGGSLVTDKPDSPHRSLARVTARMYFGCADNDRSCPPEHRATLAAALTDAGVRHEIELYAGKGHGFAVDDMPVYDPDACEQHWRKLFTLFGTLSGAAAA